MIKDTDTLTEIQACWNGVENLRGKIQRSLFASVGFLGGTFPFAAADAAHNQESCFRVLPVGSTSTLSKRSSLLGALSAQADRRP